MQEIDLGGAGTVRVPTPAEALRINAYLVVQRNQTRDCPTPPCGTVARRPSWRHTRTSTRWLSWADVVTASQVLADGLLKRVEGDLE